VGDKDFAAQCAKIFASGSKITEERLFNGEYFVQDVDVQKHPHWQYADGCLADQLFGQGWAHQLGLGYVYSKETVRKALESIWKYCWTPDIDSQNKRHAPERWFAFPGEAGLFTCTWPKSKRPGPPATRYCDEVWTGIEYQVANHMAWEGMVTEALALCRAAHDRYHPSKRNPFNEIECGDHYARSLASWGLITSLSGFEHHNSKGTLGFAPRIEADNFRSVFTTAEGWGTYEQKRSEGELRAEVQVTSGEVRLTTLRLAISEGTLPAKAEVAVGGNTMELAVTDTRDGQIELRFVDEAIVSSGEKLAVREQTTRIDSPDGKVAVTVTTTDVAPYVSYTVERNGAEVVAPSALDVQLREVGSLADGAELVEVVRGKFDTTSTMPWGKARTIRDHGSTATLEFLTKGKARWRLAFRVYNDGVAFRYEFPKQTELTDVVVEAEQTEFRLTGDPSVTYLPLPNFTSTHEGLYGRLPMSDLPEDQLFGVPLLAVREDGDSVMITEARLRDYAGMYLERKGASDAIFTSRLSPLPGKPSQCVVATAPHSSPWRVVMLADHPGRFIESQLIEQLNDPAEGDFAWLEPGKTTFPWWNGEIEHGKASTPDNNFE
ncbi:unnamed protein product, partial [Symbiodinium sp. CCMP2456]